MKKIIFLLILVISVSAFKADAQQLKFYYYPGSNVYYDVANKQYVYVENGNWVTVSKLPARVKVVNTPRYIVYNNDRRVWVNNGVHVKKYKDNRPNGKATGYKGSNPNKSSGKKKLKIHS
jgi:hypothetical protein